MQTKIVKKITISAMFLAIGYVLPFLTGQIAEIGNMLLPMHLPVMLSGLILGPWYGLFIGAVLPLTRSLVFSAPPLFPNAVGMTFELATYGFVIGLVFVRARWRCMRSLYRALLISMLSGRVVFGVVQTVILGLANKAFGFGAFIASAFFEAIPGIILQLIIIPAIMLALDKTHLMPPRSKKREGQTCLSPAVAIDELSEIIERIAEKKGRAVVAIDGRCSAGKTTLAEALADRLGAAVFHLDDFFLPESLREEGYIESTGANADIERFLSEVLLPLSRGESVFYSPFCCKTGEYLTRVEVKPEKIVIVEGSYSCHPQLSPYYDLSIFVYISEELQLARLKARDEAKLPAFKNRWIPMEEAYFERFGIKESCKILISHEQP